MNDNLDVIVQAKLDQSSKAIQKLKNDIYSLEKKLKNTKIKLDVQLDNSTINKLKDQLAKIQAEGTKSMNVSNFDRISESSKDNTLYADDAGAVRNLEQDVGNTEISKMTPKIVDANNRLWEFATTTKTVNNTVEKEKHILDQATGAMYKHNEATKQGSSRSLSLVQQMGEAIKNTVTCALTTDLLNNSLRALKDGIQIIKDLDAELTQVSIMTGMTTEETKELSLKYVELGRDMGRSVSEISKINTELVKQGLSAEESMSRIQTVLKLSTSTGMNTNEASSFITTSENIIGQDAQKTADVMLKAGQISTASAKEIGEALTKTASSAKATGMSIEELSAIFSTLAEVTQEDPSLMGESLKTLLERFTEINEVTGEVNKDFNKIQAAFKSVGITFTDTTGHIRPMYKLLQELSLKWKDLDKSTQMYMATQTAGAGKANLFLSIMNNFSHVQSKNNKLMGAGGTLNKSYSKYLGSVEASANRAKASFEEMWIKALDSDVIKDFYDASTAITTLIGNVGVLRVAFTTLAAVMLLNNEKFRNFSDKIADRIIKRFTSLRTGTTQTTTSLIMLGTTSATTAGSMGILSTITTFLKAAFTKLNISSKLLKVSMIGLKAVITGGLSLAISFIIEGIMGWIAASERSKQETEELTQSVKSNIQTYQGNIKTLRSIQKEYETLNQKLGENRDITNLTAEEQDRYNALVEQIAQIAPEAITAYDDKGQAIIAYTTKIDTLIDKEKELIDLENNRLLTEEGEIVNSSNKEINSKEKKIKNIDRDIERYQKAIRGEYNPDSIIRDRLFYKPLGELRTELDKLNAERKILLNDIETEKGKQKELLDIHFLQIDGKDGISSSLKQAAKTKVLDIFNEDGYYKATKTIGSLQIAFDKMIESLDSGEESNAKIEEAKNILNELGLSTQEVDSILFQFNNNIKTTEEVLSTMPSSITTTIDQFKELTNVVSNLDSTFNKLASGKELSSDDLMKLVEKYDEVAKYVAETGDLSLDDGELIKKLRDKNIAQLENEYKLKMQSNQDKLNSARREQKEQEEILKKAQEGPGEESDDYKKQKQLVDEVRNRVKDLNNDFNKSVNDLKAIDSISAQCFRNSEIDSYAQSFKYATSKLNKYKEILEEINEHGVLSGETNQEIIQEHSELIYYLGQEGDMRTYLMALIDEYGIKQIEAYKNALLASDEFSKHVLRNNKELFKKIAKLYDIDLENFTTVQNLKEQMKLKDKDVLSAKGKKKLENYHNETDKNNAEKEMIVNAMRYYSTDSITRRRFQGALEYVNTSSIKDLLTRNKQIDAEEALKKANEDSQDDFDPDNLFKDFNNSSSNDNHKNLQKIETVELSTDRYVKYNKAIEEVERSIDANNQFIELSTNKDKITLLSKEVDLLKEKQNILHLTADEYRREKNELSAILSEKINLEDGTMGIDSFNGYSRQVQDSINSIIDKINNSSDESIRDRLTEQKDDIQNEYDKLKEDFDRYLEVQTTISGYSSNWWEIEKEKFSRNMEILETDLQKYAKEIEHINDKLTLRITVGEDSLDQMEKDFKLIKDMSNIYELSLNDIDVKIKSNDSKLAYYENKINALGNVHDNGEYKRLSKYIVMNRAKQDKLLEEEKNGVSAFISLKEKLIDNYIKQLDYGKDETIKALQDTRKVIDTFNDNEFQNSTEEILTDLNKIDDIYVIDANFKLSTNDAREELTDYSDFYSSIVDKINDNEEKATNIMSIQADTEQEQEDKKNNIIELIKDEIDLENELKDLEVEKQNEIDKLTLSYKRNEDALKDMIDTKQKELQQLQEQFDQEDKTKEMLEKQIELMRVMDDERYSYITGMGEEVFTYDQSKVSAIQEELAEMKQENEREAMINALQDEISQMKEDLSTTKDIHQQELEVLKLAHQSIKDLTSKVGDNINEKIKENGLEKIYEDIKDNFIKGIKEVFQPFIDRYDEHLDNKSNRSKLEKGVDEKQIEQNKLNPHTDVSQDQQKAKINQYIVKPNDTLGKIAQQFFTTVDELLKLNPQITNPNLIYPNQKINISKFNTGGYTGVWGTEGRLGILHEKELILNKDDTTNVLNTIDLAKGIFDNLTQVDRVVGQSSVTNNKDNKSIVLNNPVFNGVKDVNKFVNELNGLFRRGMPSIS